MRIPAIQGTRFIASMLLLAGLIFCRGASAQAPPQSQPDATGAASGATNAACAAQSTTSSTANGGSAGKNGNPQQSSSSVDAAAQNAKAAIQNLGSLFGKKKAQAAATAPPCPPATSTAAPGSPGSAAPTAGATAQPANSSAQPGAPNSAAPSTATVGTAAPWSPDSGSTVGAAATAGSASTFASNAPADFSKLPDIAGQLRIGMLPDDVQPAELKMHPGAKVIPMPEALATFRPYSSTGKPPYIGMRAMFGVPDGKHDDTSEFFYTMQPAKQQVYEMNRIYSYPDPGIDRLKLVAALRQKYGPETKAMFFDQQHASDQYIVTMYWVYDEQGHLHAPDKGAPGNAPFNCQASADSNTWGNMVSGLASNSLPPASFCDTVVEMVVSLNGPSDNNSRLGGVGWQSVVKTITTIMDFPLLRRSAMVAADAKKAAAQQQQQQQLDQSKKAMPTL